MGAHRRKKMSVSSSAERRAAEPVANFARRGEQCVYTLYCANEQRRCADERTALESTLRDVLGGGCDENDR